MLSAVDQRTDRQSPRKAPVAKVAIMAGSYFLTTAIDYVNSAPHLGHAYEKVLADFFARHQREPRARRAFPDRRRRARAEGAAIGAEARASSRRLFADQMSAHFQRAARKPRRRVDHISSAPRTASHKTGRARLAAEAPRQGRDFLPGARGLLQRAAGAVRHREGQGRWPVARDFRRSRSRRRSRIITSGSSPTARGCSSIIEENPDWIVPAFRRNELLGALKEPLADLCISRPKSAAGLGHSAAVQRGLRHLRLVRRAGELLLVRLGEGRRCAGRPICRSSARTSSFPRMASTGRSCFWRSVSSCRSICSCTASGPTAARRSASRTRSRWSIPCPTSRNSGPMRSAISSCAKWSWARMPIFPTSVSRRATPAISARSWAISSSARCR